MKDSSEEGSQSARNSYVKMDGEITFEDLLLLARKWWKYLLSKWLILIIAGLVGGVAGFVYAYSKKPLYTAELSFVLEGGKQGGGMSNYAGLASQFGIDMGGNNGGIFEGENFLALMRSRSMIQKALLTSVVVDGQRQTLAEFYMRIEKMRERWIKENSSLKNVQFLPDANPANFSLEQNSLLKGFHGAIVRDNLVIGNQDKKSNIMAISVTSVNELFSKYFTEVLAKEVSDFYIDTKVKNIRRNVTALEYQVDSVRNEFNSAISKVASSTDANPNPNPARKSLQIPSQRRQVDAQANQVLLVQLMQNLAIAQNALREQTPLIQIIDSPVLPLNATSPNRIRMGLLGGFLAGFLAAFLLVILKALKLIK